MNVAPSGPTRRELIAVVALVLILLGVAWLGAERLADPLLPDQRQAVDLLDDLRQADVDKRVVVLGTSLDRNALGEHSLLGAALSTDDQTVGAVNLGPSAAGYETWAPIWDSVWATEPDLIVIQPDVFRRRVRDGENSLRTQVRRMFAEDEPPLSERRCPEQTEGLLERSITRNLARLEEFPPYLLEAQQFVDETEARVIPVLVYVPPRSEPVVEALNGEDVAWREELYGVLFAAPHVHGPLDFDATFTADLYCDWTHLDLDGAALLLQQWVPAVRELLATTP